YAQSTRTRRQGRQRGSPPEREAAKRRDRQSRLREYAGRRAPAAQTRHGAEHGNREGRPIRGIDRSDSQDRRYRETGQADSYAAEEVLNQRGQPPASEPMAAAPAARNVPGRRFRHPPRELLRTGRQKRWGGEPILPRP